MSFSSSCAWWSVNVRRNQHLTAVWTSPVHRTNLTQVKEPFEEGQSTGENSKVLAYPAYSRANFEPITPKESSVAVLARYVDEQDIRLNGSRDKDPYVITCDNENSHDCADDDPIALFRKDKVDVLLWVRTKTSA